MDTSPVELAEPKLFGPARQLLGDLPYPSNNPTQWLCDTQIPNAHAADDGPEGNVPVFYNYPRPQSLVPAAFSETNARRVLERENSVMLQQFCDGIHWHDLVLMGPERTLYYWEPMGRERCPSAIAAAFERNAPSTWKLVIIPLKLQADGHSCGDWAHWFRCRVLAYVADPQLLGSGTFPEYLRGDLTNLKDLRGTPLKEAESKQRRFARKRRDALRELLFGAAQRGALPWGDAQLDAFLPQQQQGRIVIDFTKLDARR